MRQPSLAPPGNKVIIGFFQRYWKYCHAIELLKVRGERQLRLSRMTLCKISRTAVTSSSAIRGLTSAARSVAVPRWRAMRSKSGKSAIRNCLSLKSWATASPPAILVELINLPGIEFLQRLDNALANVTFEAGRELGWGGGWSGRKGSDGARKKNAQGRLLNGFHLHPGSEFSLHNKSLPPSAARARIPRNS